MPTFLFEFFFPLPPISVSREIYIRDNHTHKQQSAHKKKRKQICLRSRVLRRGVVLLLARTNTRASVVEAQEESQCNERNTLHLRRVKARRR